MKIYKESNSDFSIEFGGENEIEATILIETMNSIVESLQSISRNMEPEAYVKVKVSSFDCGSFDINLKTVVEFTKNLFNKNTMEMAAAIVTVLVGSIEIKKHLKGEKPKDIKYEKNNALIQNIDNELLKKDKVIAETYFSDNSIDKSITNIFNIVHTTGDRDSLAIKQGEDNIVQIKKGEFVNMSKSIIIDEDMIAETMINIIEVNLLLKKPDLLGNSKWGFVLDKNIEATIEDKEWLEKVHSGDIILYAGVKVPVKLHIESNLDKNRNIITSKYTVLEIIGDIIEPDGNDNEQLTLF